MSGIAPGSWIVIESPFRTAAAWTIHHAQEMARAEPRADFLDAGLEPAVACRDPASADQSDS